MVGIPGMQRMTHFVRHDRDGSPSIRCIEVDVSRLQAKDLSDTQRENHAQMNSKVKRRVGHGLQLSLIHIWRSLFPADMLYSAAAEIIAVSYTHLDVYKRQRQGRSSC